MSYGTDIVDIYGRAATYVRRLIIDFRSDRLSGAPLRQSGDPRPGMRSARRLHVDFYFLDRSSVVGPLGY
jgi:hypothetical protein